MNGLVRAYGLSTFVQTECDSACTTAFFAGKKKYLRRGAALGLPAPSTRDGRVKSDNRHLDEKKRLYLDAGLPDWFVERAMSEYGKWGGDTDLLDLIETGAVTEIVDESRFASSGIGPKTATERFETRLRLAFMMETAAVEKAEYGRFESAAKRFMDDYLAGKSYGEILPPVKTALGAEAAVRFADADDAALSD
jgi:hypothetical protein